MVRIYEKMEYLKTEQEGEFFIWYLSILLFASIIRMVFVKWQLETSHLCIWLLIGIIIGIFLRQYSNLDKTLALEKINIPLLIYTIFPIHVFEIGYFFNSKSFKENIIEVLLAAVPAFILSTVLCFFYFYYLLLSHSEMAFLFASVTCLVSPSERFVNLCTKADTKGLITLLQGESIICSIIVFSIYDFKLKSIYGIYSSSWFALLEVIYFIGGGIIFGLCLGVILMVILSYIYNDFTTEILLTISFIYLSLICSSKIIGVSELTTVMGTSIVLSSSRKIIPARMHQQMLDFWVFITQTAKLFMCIIFGIAVIPIGDFPPRIFLHILLCYFFALCSRAISLLIIIPGYRYINKRHIKWFSVLIHIWSGERGIMNCVLALILCHLDKTKEEGKEFAFIITGMVFMTLLLNSATLNLILNYLSMHLLKNKQYNNMIFALAILEQKRKGFLNILRTDPELMKANWSLVEKATIIHNPYKLSWKFNVISDSKNAANFIQNLKENKLIDKRISVTVENSTLDLMWDSNLLREKDMENLDNILMIMFEFMEVSFIRQKHEGRLTINSCTRLLEFTKRKKINLLTNTNETKTLLSSIKYMENLTTFDTAYFVNIIRKNKRFEYWFLSENVNLSFKDKKSTLKKMLFKIITNPVREGIFCIFYGLYGIFNVLLIYNLFYIVNTYEYLNLIFLCWIIVYWIMGGISLKSKIIKWRPFWILNDIILFLSVILFLIKFSPKCTEILLYIITICYLLYFFRLLEVYKIFLLQRMFRRIILCSETITEIITPKGYLECIGLVSALEETQIWLRNSISYKTTPKAENTINILRKLLLKQKMDIIKELNNINQSHLWIGYTFRTRQAIFHILINLEAEIEDYKDQGLLDELEANLLNQEIASLTKATISHLNYIKPPKRSKYLFSIPWLDDDIDLIVLLTSYSEGMYIPAGENIVVEGQIPDELILVSTGIVKMNYKPTTSVIKHLKDWGIVPNRGFVSSIRYDCEGSDVLPSMNLIGLHGLLTGREYSTSIETITDTHIYRISIESIRQAVKSRDDNFENKILKKMWRQYTLNLSKYLMLRKDAHQSRLTRQMCSDLNRGFMVMLKSHQGIHLTSYVRNTILVEGVLETLGDDESGFKFVAPIMLPFTVSRLRAGMVPEWINTSWAARIYIVPIAEMSLEVVRESLNLRDEVRIYYHWMVVAQNRDTWKSVVAAAKNFRVQ